MPEGEPYDEIKSFFEGKDKKIFCAFWPGALHSSRIVQKKDVPVKWGKNVHGLRGAEDQIHRPAGGVFGCRHHSFTPAAREAMTQYIPARRKRPNSNACSIPSPLDSARLRQAGHKLAQTGPMRAKMLMEIDAVDIRSSRVFSKAGL